MVETEPLDHAVAVVELHRGLDARPGRAERTQDARREILRGVHHRDSEHPALPALEGLDALLEGFPFGLDALGGFGELPSGLGQKDLSTDDFVKRHAHGLGKFLKVHRRRRLRDHRFLGRPADAAGGNHGTEQLELPKRNIHSYMTMLSIFQIVFCQSKMRTFLLTMPSLLDPTLLFFAFGIFAGIARSNLEIPAQASKILCHLLLIALGLKGGFALAKSGFDQNVLTGLGCALLLATVIPILGFLLLRRILPPFDAVGLAASYGSVSAVAFIAATQRLEDAGLAYGGHMSAAMALMESPAIILGVVAAGFLRNADATSDGARLKTGKILHESLTDGTQLLLLGSMVIGYVTAEPGRTALQPLFIDLFKCVLALFLLDMGLMVARNLNKLSGGQAPALAYAVLSPPAHAGLALLLCRSLGVPAGDGALLMTLAASSSFIAVPAVLRLTVPEANPSLYFGVSLTLNFPLNLLFGIPLWIELARRFLPA